MIRSLVRALCWLAFVPAFVIFGLLAAFFLWAAIATRAIPPS